jgi:membrane-associated protein
METLRFTLFNIVGAVAWVASICYLGYFFGNIPWIRNNLTAIIVGIIVVSMVPVVIAWLKERKK